VGLKEVLTFPLIWNVPYRRNPFFTGREDVLKNLHTTLIEGNTAALTQPQAISGLGGIGKTQVAVEYAYRNANEYQAVLWVKADSREVLISDFVSIADPLDLPEKNEQDQNRVVNAVKRWLQNHVDWLLILDNVEELEIIDEFVPPAVKGHILLTTRAQATGTANSAGIENLSEYSRPEHLHTATVLQNHARLLRKTNREVKAAELEAKAKTIRIKHTQKNLEQ
jgi:NB-ARC domain